MRVLVVFLMLSVMICGDAFGADDSTKLAQLEKKVANLEKMVFLLKDSNDNLTKMSNLASRLQEINSKKIKEIDGRTVGINYFITCFVGMTNQTPKANEIALKGFIAYCKTKSLEHELAKYKAKKSVPSTKEGE
ncbi:MAG: hypothetical protein OXC40_08090 [Proteobacteria bacterium]|nr:hypothetical protein [Pseudomonadota bacterium]